MKPSLIPVLTREDTTAHLRLAGRVARDLFPGGRIGGFLLALANDVEHEDATPQEGLTVGRDMLDAVARGMPEAVARGRWPA